MKILVVDNDRLILEFLKDVLSVRHHEVRTAEDAFSAIKILEAYRPDVIVTDLFMPKMSGKELFGIIRGKEALKNVYLIVLTGGISDEEIDIRSIGADACIQKRASGRIIQDIYSTLDKAQQTLLQSTSTKSDTIDVMSIGENVVEKRVSDGKVLEKTTKMTQDELEKRVTERTFALIQANANLKNEIEDLKKAQDEIRRQHAKEHHVQKMEALGTLAGEVAHDFNHILMGIQGRASLMLMGSCSSYAHFKELKTIEKYVQTAEVLTRRLLGFAGGGKYEVKPTNLNELIKGQNPVFGLARKDITIYEQYEKDIWKVEVDQGQIGQVVLDLCLNAEQSMPDGGTITIKTENVILDDSLVKPYDLEPGRYVNISIIDTGEGMDKAIQEKIFDPYFTTKKGGRNPGLGLASAYGIIKNHSGIIDFQSEKGKGSIFNIYLPVAEQAKSEMVKIPKIDSYTNNNLLVDEEDMIIALGRRL